MPRDRSPAPAWLTFPVLLGLYLTAHGYHSRDGDQAYRLPLLLHLQDPGFFADDPFVRSFDAFNPHLGYLGLLDLASRPFGLSAALFGLFAATFFATAIGIDRLARSCWPSAGRGGGVVAVVLVLLAQAGNIGTNHLFEATLLDRLLAMSLGWLAFSSWVGGATSGRWVAPPLLGLAAWVHPSMGLQLAMLLGGVWTLEIVAAFFSRGAGTAHRLRSWMDGGPCPPYGERIDHSEPGRGSATAPPLREHRAGGTVSIRKNGPAILWLAACLIPSIVAIGRQNGALLRGLPAGEFWLLSAFVQGPRHMIPHLWRAPQWLAWGCYPVLALMALVAAPRPWPAARTRLAALLGVNLLGLILALAAIEGLADLRVTLFQPFRLATVFRGLCLVAIADRVLGLWGGGFVEKGRAVLIASGLIGDWTLVAATAVEVAASAPGFFLPDRLPRVRFAEFLAPGSALLGAMLFLSRHDTESGHLRLAIALSGLVVFLAIRRLRPIARDRRRAVVALSIAWAPPVASMIAQAAPIRGKFAESLAARCHFAEVPVGDVERLAVWCRENTPRSARFVGPPGPKEFRLWSGRSLAFNRAGSPYHAAGLADWAARFRDHVGFDGPLEAFASAYLADRHGLERRYDLLGDDRLAALARRQGADHVLKARTSRPDRGDSPLEFLHAEGRYAAYRVRASYPSASLANASH